MSTRRLIIVLGLPGSGKSFFARAFAGVLDCTVLSSDQIRREITEEPDYSADEKTRIYEELLRRTRMELDKNRTVVVEATFSKLKYRLPFFKLADEMQIPLFILKMEASEKVIQDRLATPRPDSDADFSIYKKLKKENSPLAEEHLILHSDQQNLEEMLSLAEGYLDHNY